MKQKNIWSILFGMFEVLALFIVIIKYSNVSLWNMIPMKYAFLFKNSNAKMLFFICLFYSCIYITSMTFWKLNESSMNDIIYEMKTSNRDIKKLIIKEDIKKILEMFFKSMLYRRLVIIIVLHIVVAFVQVIGVNSIGIYLFGKDEHGIVNYGNVWSAISSSIALILGVISVKQSIKTQKNNERLMRQDIMLNSYPEIIFKKVNIWKSVTKYDNDIGFGMNMKKVNIDVTLNHIELNIEDIFGGHEFQMEFEVDVISKEPPTVIFVKQLEIRIAGKKYEDEFGFHTIGDIWNNTASEFPSSFTQEEKDKMKFKLRLNHKKDGDYINTLLTNDLIINCIFDIDNVFNVRTEYVVMLKLSKPIIEDDYCKYSVKKNIIVDKNVRDIKVD